MRKKQFEAIVDKIPSLTDNGLGNDIKAHEDFKSKAIHLLQNS